MVVDVEDTLVCCELLKTDVGVAESDVVDDGTTGVAEADVVPVDDDGGGAVWVVVDVEDTLVICCELVNCDFVVDRSDAEDDDKSCVVECDVVEVDDGIFGAVADDDDEAAFLFLEAISN